MIETDKDQTKAIINGQANAFSMVYFKNGRPVGDPPYKEGSEIDLCVTFQGTTEGYAKARVISMYREDIDARKNKNERNSDLAKGEGFSSVEAWVHAFNQKYGARLRGYVWRVQFQIVKLRGKT